MEFMNTVVSRKRTATCSSTETGPKKARMSFFVEEEADVEMDLTPVHHAHVVPTLDEYANRRQQEEVAALAYWASMS